ncbi:ERCC4 domain-containing protein [Aspergillus avenaceus]|uniref:ERCC4 domain-containing protein n=1 Tax=Aspergillus avenaceus TaxID=36643 RepID=A0A5N6U8M7_ASPAV|nr:ERCC4 domain-containing protein [Aspergillus avenaceus]
MPEVISLLSSTPPPSYQPRQPSLPSSPNQPPAAAPPITLPIISSEIDIPSFNYDDDLYNNNNSSSKRRRISEEPESTLLPPPPSSSIRPGPSRNNLFLFSDDILPSSEGNTKAPARGVDESDPIVFTSSAPEPEPVRGRSEVEFRRAHTETITIDDDDDVRGGGYTRGAVRSRKKDGIERFSDELGMSEFNELLGLEQSMATRPGLSSRTANLLASLEGRSGSSGQGRSRTAAGRRGAEDLVEVDDDVDKARKPARKTTAKNTSAEKEAKAKEREAAKAQREREKQLEKERKQKVKEDKAREKQLAAELAGVNKLKVDKKDSTPEMIIDLASNLQQMTVGEQTVEFMTRLKVEQTFFESPIPNVIKWRRKATATYNDSLGHWEPCAFHIREEQHVLVLLNAQDFVNMVIAPPPSPTTTELDTHVLNLKSTHPASKPIYLIEGLTAWMRKNHNSRNRAYQAELRRQYEQSQPQPQPSTTTTRRRKQQQPNNNKPETTPPVDDDTIEDALLQLQVTHSCLIHHTATPTDSAEWIKNFTEHISTVPYRREMMESNDSAFCMDGGQVKPGENKPDTFIKMLQEVNRITPSMAYGITTRYPSAVDLVRAMRRHGPGLLEDVKKSANRNGALTDSRIGPAASKRLYKVFMGLEPSSTDV